MAKKKPTMKKRMKTLGKDLKAKDPSFWIVIVMVGLIAGGGIWLFAFNGLARFQTVEQIETADTAYEFEVLDYVTSAVVDDDDYEIYIYNVDIEDHTTADYEDLSTDEVNEIVDDFTFSDYALDDTADAGNSFTPEDHNLYWCKINGSDIYEQWFVPVLGMNTIKVMNATEDLAMIAYGSDSFSSTINQTNDDKVTIRVTTLDGAEGTGEPTNFEGMLPYYDYEDDDEYMFVIKVTLNSSASASMVDMENCDYDYTEVIASSAVYYEIDAVILGEMEFEIDFHGDLGTTFECLSIAVGFGNAGSFTQYDTQS